MSVWLQHKCEQYWNNDLDNPFNAVNDLNVVTTRYRGFVDYDVRDLTVKNLRRLSLIILPVIHMYGIVMKVEASLHEELCKLMYLI